MKKLSELSLEELIRNKARLKNILIAFGIVFTLLICACLYVRFFKSGSVILTPFIVIPITWIPLFISLKNMTDEIKFRRLKNK